MTTKCPDSPDGMHEFEPDLEYDQSGETINCVHCGEPAPEGWIPDDESPWTDELPDEPGHYWYRPDAVEGIGMIYADPLMLNVQRWEDCAPASDIKLRPGDTLVVVRHYNHGKLVYDLVESLEGQGIFCQVDGPPPVPERFKDRVGEE